jgi:hypothetical protein
MCKLYKLSIYSFGQKGPFYNVHSSQVVMSFCVPQKNLSPGQGPRLYNINVDVYLLHTMNLI